ncbi:MAG: flagellar motor switch protein FliM [Alphaproteobacteria bacterium]|uniref:Flagellar motor switch protein FliM n=1 Tax=Candidatus Nitrobium versatile TaxID=2884831 RepID=A0A953J4U1_9BACT|nr:flagellar motor switch protein FliM [Candidatus Nitrobium versatile]
MEDILSQDEVDALLKGIADGEVETEKLEETSGVKVYDFTGQEKIVRGRMPSLDIANERLARNFRLSLSAAIRHMVDVTNVNVNITKFYDFMRGIPFPSSINIYKMEPLRGFGLLVFDAPMIFSLIEFFFGGTGKGYYKPEGREFTPIEQKIIHKVVLMFFDDMEEAWKPVYPIKPIYVRSEMNPQFVTIVTPVDVVIKVEFVLEIEGKQCKAFLCIPYGSVEPIKEKLYSAFSADRDELDVKWLERLNEGLKEIPLALSGELGRTTLTVQEILQIKTGDTLILNTRADEDLNLLVEGVPKFKGRFGVFKGAQAMKITSVLPTGGKGGTK